MSPEHEPQTLRPRLNRRRFIAVTGTSAIAAAISQPLFRTEAFAAPLVRLDVGGLTAASKTITSYAKAIKIMKGLSSSNPTSWAYQAAIHGTSTVPKKPRWDTCEHNTEFFWSWHRMYLYWFERIIRHHSGDKTWTLPFWAWDSPSERQVPSMFRSPASPSNQLYVSRTIGSGSLSAATVDYSSDFATKIFHTALTTGANDQFQGTPHGAVHVAVGGLMCCVDTAAEDPIFYLHHANCDRLWQVWRASYSGIDPTTDATWTGKTFTFFNEFGKPVTMSDCQIVNAAQQLNYVYQGVPSLTPETCPAITKVCCIPVFTRLFVLPHIPPLGALPVRIPLPIPPEQAQRLMAVAHSTTQTAYLHLQGVAAPTQPGVGWAVFVGSGSQPAAAMMAPGAANSQNAQYVGQIVLFGSGVRDEAHGTFIPAQFSFRLNRAIAASSTARSLAVTFVPVSLVAGVRPQVRANVQIGRATIVVESLKGGQPG